MNLDGSWLAVGAVTAAIAAAWSYVRWGWSYIASFVIVRANLDADIAEVLVLYLQDHARISPYGVKCYGSSRFVLRGSGKVRVIPFERLAEGTLFLCGWRPIWIKTTRPQTNSGEGIAMPVTFLRRTFVLEELLVEAAEYANQFDQASRAGEPRFKLVTLAGADKRIRAQLDHMAGVGVDTRQVLDFMSTVPKSWRLIGSDRSDVGIDSAGTPSLSMLALGEEASRFVSLVRSWYGRREWYRQRSVPWKLGARLVGPPGTGKTSLVRCLAYELDMPIYIFDLSNMTNAELRENWGKVRANTPAIALFEDLHKVFDGDRAIAEESQLTMDALLQCLSGVDEIDGVLSIVTTNEEEKLDPALIRPGRIELEVRMVELDSDGCRRIAERILRDWPELIDSVVQEMNGRTGAEVQQRCVALAAEMVHRDMLGSTESPEYNTLAGLDPLGV